jgi:hypothetical protein
LQRRNERRTARNAGHHDTLGIEETSVSIEQDSGKVPVLMRPAAMHEEHWPPRGKW